MKNVRIGELISGYSHLKTKHSVRIIKKIQGHREIGDRTRHVNATAYKAYVTVSRTISCNSPRILLKHY